MRPIYYNDKNAPRMKKGKFITRIVTKDLWRKFKKEFKEHKDITWDEFFKAWLEIAETIRNEIITNPLGVKLPMYIGELKLQYLPNRKITAPDYVNSAELGKKVELSNLITRGKVASLKWERREAVKFNRILQFYAFEPIRTLNPMAKEYIDKSSEKLRMSRITKGGQSVWGGRFKYRYNPNAKRKPL